MEASKGNGCPSRVRRLLAPLAAASLLLLSGCFGGDRLDRIPVHGTVHFPEGQATSGAISLLPEPGHHGPAATAAIDQGRFEFTEEDGPVAGPHLVIVQLDPPTKAELLAGQAQHPGPPARPAKTRWELHVEIPESGPFSYDVKLE